MISILGQPVDPATERLELAVAYDKDLTFQKFSNLMDTLDQLPALERLTALTISVEQFHRPLVIRSDTVRTLVFTEQGLSLQDGLLSPYEYQLPLLETIEFQCERFGNVASPNLSFVESLLKPGVKEVRCRVPCLSHRFFPELQRLCVHRVKLFYVSPEKTRQMMPTRCVTF